MRRTIVAACIAAASVVVTTTMSAEAAATHNLTNGYDPFASCTTGGDDFGGVVFPATEPEVWLDSDPSVPGLVGGAFQQDRWSDGGAKGLVAITHSANAGSETPLPFSACAEPTYAGHGNVVVDPYAGNGIPQYFDRASDPWISYGPDGTAYSVSISFDANDNGGGVAAATSTDGGATWTNQQMVTAENPADPSLPFDDKESVTADPTTAGRAYAVWDHLDNVACNTTARPDHAPSADDRVVRPESNQALDCFIGPAELSFTSNGGSSWSAPQVIVPTPTNEQTIANQIVVDPASGHLFDVFMYIHADNSLTIEDVVSTNQGSTWSAPHVIAQSETVGVTDPASGAPLRTGDIIPEVAVDPSNGELYVVWQDSRASAGHNEDGLLITSSANGVTWSSPAVVENRGDAAAFTPAIRVLGDHRVAVEYYSFNPSGDGNGVMPVRPVIRFTRGAGTTFAGVEQPLGPFFNMLAAPFAGGFFTGDYEGLAVDTTNTSSVHTFYNATTCDTTACDAVAGFDENGNPVASDVADPTDVFSQVVFDSR